MTALTPALRVTQPNRRRRVRHKILTPAYASFTGESKGAMLDLYEVVDISEDGVAIRCNSRIESNRRFNLCLDLAESSGSIYTTGQVIWSSDSGRSGLRFSGLAPDSLLRLREWLFLNAMAGVANAEAEAAATQPAEEEDIAVLPNYTDTLAAVTAVRREVEAFGTDLVAALQLIATRAQTLVRASGAAIALATAERDIMICRASSGEDAPPEGARLQVGSGFSGECVRTGRILRCDDTETDSRVDRDNCRALGIRSILASPVRLGEKVIGIVEVFAPQPDSFSEDDSTILQRLSDTVLAAVNRAARAEAPALLPASSSDSFTPGPGSVLFAAEVAERERKEERDRKDKEKMAIELEDDNPGGVRMPRSLLLLLIMAAAMIAMTMGFVAAPWIQAKLNAPGHSHLPTVFASSQPAIPTASVSASAGPSTAFATGTLEQLRVLAEQGDATAENGLGVRYATGDGVKLDYTEAARWFTKSATQGNIDAQYKLALLYWGGHGVQKDSTKAYFWAVMARAGNHEGGSDLVRILTNDLTDAQAARIGQEAEQWFQQHQITAKSTGGR